MDKIIYYEDEQKDDFSGVRRKTIRVDKNYKYQKSLLWKVGSFILYRCIMTPIAYFYMKLKFNFKIINKSVLKKHRKSCYFLYANHTQIPGDGYMPSVLCFPKKVKVLVHADNVSLKGTKNFMEMIGAVPIPNHFSGMPAFKNILHQYVEQKNVIMIYPEAHIWPYYTKIRPFGSVSFTYPYLENKPVYCFTVTYQKGFIRTNIKAYVDGPFYPNLSLPKKEAIEELRNIVYETMNKRSKYSSYEKIKYIKKESV